ncbi:hypothetical protein D3C87_1405580 [compost metagenome]
MLGKQGLPARGFFWIVEQCAFYQSRVGLADIGLGDKAFDILHGQPFWQGFAPGGVKGLVSIGQRNQVLQGEIGNAECVAVDLARNGKGAPDDRALDAYLNHGQIKLEVRLLLCRDGMLYGLLHMQCVELVQCVLLDRQYAVQIRLAGILAVQRRQVFQVP